MQSLPGPERTDAAVSKSASRKMGDRETFRLIEPGDRIMVAMSGGKDSHALLTLLDRFRRRLPDLRWIDCPSSRSAQPADGEPLERWLGMASVSIAQDVFRAKKVRRVTHGGVLDCAGFLDQQPLGCLRLPLVIIVMMLPRPYCSICSTRANKPMPPHHAVMMVVL